MMLQNEPSVFAIHDLPSLRETPVTAAKQCVGSYLYHPLGLRLGLVNLNRLRQNQKK